MTATLVCALIGLVTGALVPLVIARLPEPDPDPVFALAAEGAELTKGQQMRLDEGPKEPYVDLARLPRLSLFCALASAVVAGLLGWRLGWEWELFLVLPLAPIGTLLALVDLRTRLLPRVVVLPATAAALVYGVVAWPLLDQSEALVRGLIGLALAFGIFFVLWFIRSAGMGFGDVRLTAWLGFMLAYFGWAPWLVGLYSGFLIFGIPGLAFAIIKWDRALLKKAYPFGPFLLIGAVLGLVWGQEIIDAIYGT